MGCIHVSTFYSVFTEKNNFVKPINIYLLQMCYLALEHGFASNNPGLSLTISHVLWS